MNGTDRELCSRILSELLADNSHNHNRLYIYGNRQEISTALDRFESQYRKTFPGRYVSRTNGDTFINTVISSCKQQMESKNANIPDVLDSLVESELLIFEDVDSLAGFQASMERLYFIIDRLFERGKTIIFTAEVPPAEIKQMEKRNISQIEGCIVCNLSRQDAEYGVKSGLCKVREMGNRNDDN